MKIKIEIDENLMEEEIVIRAKTLDEHILALQKSISDVEHTRLQLNVYKGEMEYYITLEEILFFETTGSVVAVHTADQIYETKRRLYELEELLPGAFIRVSKSTILNANEIRSIHKNIAGASEVEFRSSNKRAFVSRNYFKPFMEKMEEKRLKK